MAKSNEPIWWSLFAAGGMVAALLVPITVILTGIAVPAGWISERGLYDLIHHPLSDLFVVYNEQQLTNQPTPVNAGRGLIVKYTHMLAF